MSAPAPSDPSTVADRPTVGVYVSPSGNRFMTDIATWLVEAAQLLGRSAELIADGRLPADPDAVNLVVAPHEFYPLGDADDAAIHRAASISVPVCTEQPGTPWFDMTSLLCAASPVVLDINAHGADALRGLGHDAHHLRIGAVPSIDHRPGTEAADAGRRIDRPIDRPIDLVFLGGATEHRRRRLAELAPLLWDRTSDLRLFSFRRPAQEATGGLVFGADKYDLLASSRILVNVHRDPPADGAAYFEWARLVEAMANGVAVVTEPSAGFEPLVDGEHFVMTDDLVGVISGLLGDPDRCRDLGDRAASAVLDEHPLTTSLAAALAVVEPARTRPVDPGRRPAYRSLLRRAQQIPLLPAFRPHAEFRARVYDAMSAEVDHLRRIDGVRCRLRHGVEQHETHVATSAYQRAEPEVTVIVTLFDYEHLVVETLDSILGSRDVEFEVVVVDDHSRDGGRGVVADHLADHDDVPMLLVGRDANEGLPASRNRAVELARAEKVMVMDADNLLYPTCLRRLADALDDDPGAAFAYAILEEFGERTGLQSALGWDVGWLCEANYVDAQAMVRRSTWADHGGYRTGDPLVFGWEDWELWLRLAAAGERGVHVPQILGRYRTQAESMIATSNLFGDLMLDHLVDLHPELPWPGR